MSAAREAPGVIRHRAEGSIALGEPDGAPSPRVEAIEAALARAGVPATLSDTIRGIKWAKLARNAAFNTLNARAGAAFDRVGRHENLLAVGERAMREIAAVAAAAGIRFPAKAIERGVASSRQARPTKTSTLETRRPRGGSSWTRSPGPWAGGPPRSGSPCPP